ncbi:AAA family ATPase [Actinoplanes sp. URMC 104]|uniref:AAA family ATPase n=1 Tax=Actinoplanes sp. URMC 104 TaxID=3423409 RepID=UPI003F1B4282
MPAGLRLRLLGGFRAEVAGTPVAAGAWRRSGATALVKILALRHRLHRDQVIDLLWPGADPALGAGRLHKSLHYARRVLGGDRIRLRDDLLSLDPADLWVDVDAFEAAAARGDLEEALALYTGDLLPENRFDAWAEPRRAELRAAVVPLLLERGDRAALHRVVELDPLHEEAYGRLMRLEAAQGRRHLALRWYDRLAEALRTELDVEPGDDLRRLRAELAADPPGEPAGHVPEERKLVTVLDADLRGVRDADADADPETARREVAAWTDLLAAAVERWGGTAERLVGGGVIGVFGFPAAREDHAARALWAGDEVLRSFPVPIRLGVDTGEIIAPEMSGVEREGRERLRGAGEAGGPLGAGGMTGGPARTGGRPARTGGGLAGTGGGPAGIGGPVLDSAARLRASAAPGTLLAAERTCRAAEGTGRGAPSGFRFEQAAEEAGKGARRLVGADRAAPDGRDEPPMVGRAAELGAVLGLVDEAVGSRRPRLVTVSGAAGIGKTRLVHEVIARRPGLCVLRGRCLAAGDGITYWALGEILREACGIPLGDSGGRARQRLRDRLRGLLGEPDIFALATTAGLRLPGNPLDEADPRDVADALARAWPRLATALAARQPLLLIVEDLHWAGAPLLALLTRLVARADGPVVLLATTRPGRDSADGDVVSLRALPDGDARTLLDALGHRLDPRRRAQILARADGNPYFLGQLAAHVAEGGRGALPDTLHALLAARIDALPPAEKDLLRRAAVVGRTFWAAPLRAAPAQLSALEARGLVRARPASTVAGQEEYAFQHALLRDVAYAGLPIAERAAGHAEVAGWLEEVARERVHEVIELVAVHYAAAADGPAPGEWVRGKAFRSLISAGALARRRSAVHRALQLHRRALRYAANPAERAEAIEAAGDDHETAYDGDEAVRAWREAIATLPPGNRRAGLCLKVAQMVVARWGGFRAPADPALGDRVIDAGLAVVTDPAIEAQLLALRALCGSRWTGTGRADPLPAPGRSRAAAGARRIAGRLGSPTLGALALLGQASVCFLEERYDDAVEAVLEEVALVEQEGRDRDRALGQAIATVVVGGVRGDYRGALEHARRSYDWARELSPHDRLHGTAAVLICLEQLDRLTEVDAYLDEHLSLRQGPLAAMSCPYIRSGPLVGALALAGRGEPERAREVAATVVPDHDHPGMAEAMRALLDLRLGDVTAARAAAGRMVALGRRPGPEEIPLESWVLVQALEAAGDHAALRRFLPRAREAARYLALLRPCCERISRLDPVEGA